MSQRKLQMNLISISTVCIYDLGLNKLARTTGRINNLNPNSLNSRGNYQLLIRPAAGVKESKSAKCKEMIKLAE